MSRSSSKRPNSSRDINKTSNILTIKCADFINIQDYHEQILAWYEKYKLTEIERINERIEFCNSIIAKPQIANKRKIILKQKQELINALKDLEDDIKKNKYIKDISIVLEEYHKLPQLENKVFFGQKKPIKDEYYNVRYNLTLVFLSIIDKYFNINVERKTLIQKLCKNCGFDLSTVVSETSECICPECGLTTHIFKDISLTENNISDYEDEENFMKAVYRFQGKERVNIDRKYVYGELDSYFTERGIMLGEEVRKLPLIDGRRGNPEIISKMLLRKALKYKKLTQYYDNINLICHEYWGWSLPDISYLENTLLSDYRKTELILKSIKSKDRKSTINVNIRLKFQLLARGYHVRQDDFKSIESHSILEIYDKWWKEMCEHCGDPEIKYYPII